MDQGTSHTRATRFPLQLPVRYRLQGDTEWSYGMTVNISFTGVLFRTARLSDPTSGVEIEIVLPGDHEGSTRVTGSGAVRRAFVPEGEPGDRAVAVTIDDYDFVRVPRHELH